MVTGKDSTVGWSAALESGFLAQIIDLVAHPIFVKDRAFRFVVLNRALCDLTGFSRQEMLGKTDYDFFSKAEADHFRRKDVEMFETRASVVIEEEPITDAAGGRHLLATTKVPLFGAEGEVTHLVGIIHDITRLKAAEDALRTVNEELERRVFDRTSALEAAQQDLVRRERLAVLGQLAGGLAHQIRNPLGAIANSAGLLRNLLGDAPAPDASRVLAIIDEEVWRANRIITDLLDYARVRPASIRMVALRTVIDEALRTQNIPPDVEVRLDLPKALPHVAIDADQVRDALENLILNAMEAMPEGGQLTIEATHGDGYVVATVSDTGSGLSPSVRAHLFEPLVTTKSAGMGLGLTTAQALITNQGGSLRVRPTETGACFEVRLPIKVRSGSIP